MNQKIAYQLPPTPIVDLVDTPNMPDIQLDPKQVWMLILEKPKLPVVKEIAQPELRLAGLRFNPKNRGLSSETRYTGIKIKRVSDGEERNVTKLPQGVQIGSAEWAPDGNRFVFTVIDTQGIRLWTADVETGVGRQVSDLPMNAIFGVPYSWLPNSQTLVCRFVPKNQKSMPLVTEIPIGPMIQEHQGSITPLRMVQDLLRNEYDERLFEFYGNSCLALVTLEGKVQYIGKPGLIRRAEPSPGGQYLLVEIIHRPFSYLVNYKRFPYRVAIWDLAGQEIQEIVDLPLAEGVPAMFDAVPRGPREFQWRADVSATLIWVEAQDGGDPQSVAEIRDMIFELPEPFEDKGKALVPLTFRYLGLAWGTGDIALVLERSWQTRRIRMWRIRPDKPSCKPEQLFDYSFENRANDPGMPLLYRTPQGKVALMTGDGGRCFFLVREAGRPFITQFDLETGKNRKLMRSEAPYYEQPITLLDVNHLLMLTLRESKHAPPNFYVRNLKKETMRQVTHFSGSTLGQIGVRQEMIRYHRADGVPLMANLYLPSGYADGDGPLPTLIWAYPQQFRSAESIERIKDYPFRFESVDPLKPLPLLTQGYAILGGPMMPVVGDHKANNTYLEQLIAGAEAAVEVVVSRGVANRNQIAIGGHSYGASMTASLLAHTNLFCAGIAQSGTYNRTLTPFGFQAEERTIWEAPETYRKMSPFMYADRIRSPLLLIHGEDDENSGTYPMQSERFYNALKGNGAMVRLVMLPSEGHVYRARESVLHILWEMYRWLEMYVKRRSMPE